MLRSELLIIIGIKDVPIFTYRLNESSYPIRKKKVKTDQDIIEFISGI